MRTLLADLRYGYRLLRQAPAFSAIAICALALGIGANTAIFSTLSSVVLRALPYRDADRVVMVFEENLRDGYPHSTPSPGNYFDWKAQNHVFTDIGAVRSLGMSLTGEGSPEQLKGFAATANFFDVLGMKPVVGRTYTADEDRAGAQVVVISYGLFQRRFLGDAARLAQPILLNGAKYTVVGVMPRDFVFRDHERDFWVPIHFKASDESVRGSHFLTLVARLKSGVTLEMAQQEMTAIAKRLEAQYPDTNNRQGVAVVPIKEDLLGNTRLALYVLMGAAGCVLLIACANLASLLLARGVARKKELAVRAALGAGRGRLIRQMITEAVLLAVLGGALGLLFAQAGMEVLARLVPMGLPVSAAPAMDARLLLFTLALSVTTGIIFGVIPALQAARASVNDALKQGGRSGADTRGRNTRDALVVVEVAAALVLLTGAGLMIQTMTKLRALDLGFRPEDLLTMHTPLGPKYDTVPKSENYINQVLAQVRLIPGVESAAFGSTLPFLSIGNSRGYLIEGKVVDRNYYSDALFRPGSTDYLQTLGATLLEGRMFNDGDTPAAPPVFIINESFARHYFPHESAVGHRISFNRAVPVWRTIVGVVADVRERGYENATKPELYAPITPLNDGYTPDYLVIRAKGDEMALTPVVRKLIAGVDPEQPVSEIRTMNDIIDLDVSSRQQQMTLLGAFAGLALLLACIGLYGVLSYAVTQRSREIGLRIALGATASNVIGMIVGRGLALTGVGLAIGLVASFIATRAMKNLLYGVGTTDPLTFTAVAGLLALVALIACSAPALRASRVDPITVLREE